MAGIAGKSWVMLIALLVFNFCILAAFGEKGDDDEKHDYVISIFSVKLHHKVSPSLSQETEVGQVYYNDTTSAFQATLVFGKDIPEDLVISLALSQKDPKTNQWAEKVRQTHTFCDYIVKNTVFVDNVYKDSDFPRECPIKKGTYKINNMVIDNSEFPKHLEESKWKAEIELILKDTKQSVLKFGIEVDIEPIDD